MQNTISAKTDEIRFQKYTSTTCVMILEAFERVSVT